jgi:hypothetical protein
MRSSYVSWLTAATIAFGLPVAAPTAVNAQSVMRTCATEWKQAQAAGTTGGQTWPQFLSQCRASQSGAVAAPASVPAPTPAPQSGSLIPWWQPSAPASAPASNAGAPSAAQSVMRQCASQWKEAKAAGTTGGQTWPQFLSQCRASRSAATSPSGGFAPAPAPAPAPASQSGSLFPWWQPSSAPGSAPASNVGAPSAARPGEYTTELQARATCPSGNVVWVNTSTRVYHYSGTQYYGRTHRGAYMCEADARASGFRAARNREREAQAPSG